MRSRHHHHHYRFPRAPILARGLQPTRHVDSRQDLFSSAVSKLFFDPVRRNSRARFHFPSLAEGYYWLDLVRKSRGYLDWDLGGRALRAQKVQRHGGEKRQKRREEPPFSDSLSAFSVAGNSRRYEFLVRFSFSLKFFF